MNLLLSMWKGSENLKNYAPNYDFVSFGQSQIYIGDYSGKKPKKNIKGHIDITIICLDNVYIGSGFFSSRNKSICNEPIKFRNDCIIPGSSFKGALRNIASAVSEACLPKFKKKEDKKPNNNECNDKQRCIVCDMFGTVNYASRLIIPDFKAEKADTEILELNVQYGPNPKNKKYKNEDGLSKGYKFYKTYCEKYNDDKKIEVNTVKKGSKFTGRIYFSNISKEQLSLLLFSMGIDGSFNMKIGGFKNQGLGRIKIEVLDSKIEVISSENKVTASEDITNKSPLELAQEYPNNTQSRKRQIEELKKILKP